MNSYDIVYKTATCNRHWLRCCRRSFLYEKITLHNFCRVSSTVAQQVVYATSDYSPMHVTSPQGLHKPCRMHKMNNRPQLCAPDRCMSCCSLTSTELFVYCAHAYCTTHGVFLCCLLTCDIHPPQEGYPNCPNARQMGAQLAAPAWSRAHLCSILATS